MFPAHELRLALSYDPDTGVLRRKRTGAQVFVRNKKDHPTLQIFGKRLSARSVVWALMTGEYPAHNAVKCIGGDPFDLRFSTFYKAPPGMQRCYTCGVEKPEVEFTIDRSTRSGRDTDCRGCKAAAGASRRAAIRQMNAQPDGRHCAICRVPSHELRRGRLNMDHSHTTGEFRGLLCTSCNTGLGNFKDNPRALLRAAQYLLGKLP